MTLLDWRFSGADTETVQITTLVDVLQVKYENEQDDYYKEVRMDREVRYEWRVGDVQLNRLKLCGAGMKVFSPNFGHNCWCLYLEQDAEQCLVLGVQLLRHVPGVRKLNLDVAAECEQLSARWKGRYGPLEIKRCKSGSARDVSYVCWTPDVRRKMSDLDGISCLNFCVSLMVTIRE